jgi:hypothetical protein
MVLLNKVKEIPIKKVDKKNETKLFFFSYFNMQNEPTLRWLVL